MSMLLISARSLKSAIDLVYEFNPITIPEWFRQVCMASPSSSEEIEGVLEGQHLSIEELPGFLRGHSPRIQYLE